MPANTVRRSEPRSSVSFRSLSAPATDSASTMRTTRSSTLLNSSIETVVAEGVSATPAAGEPPGRAAAGEAAPARRCPRRGRNGACRGARCVILEERIELPWIHARHQVLVGADPLGQNLGIAPYERAVHAEQLARNALGDGGQNRRQQYREHLEAVESARAHVLELPGLGRILGEEPRTLTVEVLVDPVRKVH